MLKIKKKIINPFETVFVLGGTSEIANEICLNLVQNGTKKFHFVSRSKTKNKPYTTTNSKSNSKLNIKT